MEYRYKTNGTCSKEIVFELDRDIVSNVRFLGGGCPGNLQAVPRLVEGLTVSEILSRIKGIKCGFKDTSCANELAMAIEEAYNKSKANC